MCTIHHDSNPTFGNPKLCLERICQRVQENGQVLHDGDVALISDGWAPEVFVWFDGQFLHRMSPYGFWQGIKSVPISVTRLFHNAVDRFEPLLRYQHLLATSFVSLDLHPSDAGLAKIVTPTDSRLYGYRLHADKTASLSICPLFTEECAASTEPCVCQSTNTIKLIRDWTAEMFGAVLAQKVSAFVDTPRYSLLASARCRVKANTFTPPHTHQMRTKKQDNIIHYNGRDVETRNGTICVWETYKYGIQNVIEHLKPRTEQYTSMRTSRDRKEIYFTLGPLPADRTFVCDRLTANWSVDWMHGARVGWPYISMLLYNAVLTLYPHLPLYVLLWITDWFEGTQFASPHRKVQYMEKMIASIKRVKQWPDEQ